MTEEVKKFMNNIGLEINKEKSATNDPCCEDTATLLEGIGVYKYLGIIEDSRGIPTSKSFEEVQTKPIARVERLCCTRLNSRNIFQAINQPAISLLNYHISVHRLEPADFSNVSENKIHLRPGCKERLYLPRKELGRGLHSVEFKSEHMLLQLLDCLEKSKETSTRRAAILKVENNNKTHLSLIKNFLKIKTGLEEELYIFRNNELVSVNDSLRWLKKGLVRPREEAGADGMCLHCNKSGKTVDHRATRCEKKLCNDYTGRHNEVIRVDTRIKTDVKIRYKRQNRITLIKVGITSQDSLKVVETEKLRKYDLLANDLGLIYKSSVEIIPYVMTWDGIVTKYHKTYVKRLQIPMNIEASIRSILLKKTVQTISFDRRRGLDWESSSLSVILGAEMHRQPIPPLKQVDNEEDVLKRKIQKIFYPLFWDGITTAKEPKTNANEESEERKKWLKWWK
ncbi:hypothetical protein CWI38_0449p0020 [Hamiltosporidium tvaerminnensis]|uniref:Reverse transcriptase n=2 Tax=Hamiltosporidium TaxID=1176354 RepID=A0A4Q9LXG0_9MICR|nr:hypothetical protein CWI38_0449p0020 [Hamiltosporidium tvaerminnensis]